MGDTWPKFFYHESCPEGRKFDCEENIPPGWVTGPHLVSAAEEHEEEAEQSDDDPPRRPPSRPRKMRE